MHNQDIIFIEGLTVETTIGVYSWEQAIKQLIILDVTLYTDNTKSAITDNLVDTIDYGALVDNIIAYLSTSKFNLLEALAEQVAALILKENTVHKVTVKVAKPKAVVSAKSVGVCIERTNRN